MASWLGRIRGAAGMGLTWAAGWALTGVLIGVTSKLVPGLPWDRFFEVFDAPLPALAVPGFFAGAVFSIVLGVAGRRRSFNELSLPLFGVLGAMGGLLLSLLPAALDALGLGRSAVDVWRLTAVIGGPLALLSAASACGSLLLARRAEERALPEGSEAAAAMTPALGEARDRLGGGE